MKISALCVLELNSIAHINEMKVSVLSPISAHAHMMAGCRAAKDSLGHIAMTTLKATPIRSRGTLYSRDNKALYTGADHILHMNKLYFVQFHLHSGK